VNSAALQLAAAQSRAAIARGQGDAYDHAMLGLEASSQGDFAAADQWFATALQLEPGNPSTLTSLAIHYRQQGRNRDAVLACDEAIRHYPDYPDAWLERGAILGAGGSIAAARESFAQAARLAPQHPNAHAGLASLAAREGDAEAARRHANMALSLDPSNPLATIALANAELSGGDTAQAEALLAALLDRLAEPGLERSQALTLIADVRHRQGLYAAAYDHYQAANNDFAALHATEAGRHLDQTSFIQAITDGLAASDPACWHASPGEQPPGTAPRHIFLLGYPRSGTTLVENILASLPGVAALEERPTLAATDRDHISGNPAQIVDGIARFGTLSAEQLADYRTAYWSNVAASGVPTNTAAFVDMDPMKGTRLPFIARLFPDALILLMRRDPRDVVWSCFRTSFAVSSGTLEYVTLERAARHYDALMQLTELALERLPLHVHTVDYHRLVRDFDSETRAICDFAGLEWSEAVRSFDRTSAKRGVSTASVAQVRRGLFDGTRQWEPYAEFLAPVLPILAPWIERFGYAD
jgi:Tfp pilus assembly protein PilF